MYKSFRILLQMRDVGATTPATAHTQNCRLGGDGKGTCLKERVFSHGFLPAGPAQHPKSAGVTPSGLLFLPQGQGTGACTRTELLPELPSDSGGKYGTSRKRAENGGGQDPKGASKV